MTGINLSIPEVQIREIRINSITGYHAMPRNWSEPGKPVSKTGIVLSASVWAAQPPKQHA